MYRPNILDLVEETIIFAGTYVTGWGVGLSPQVKTNEVNFISRSLHSFLFFCQCFFHCVIYYTHTVFGCWEQCFICCCHTYITVCIGASQRYQMIEDTAFTLLTILLMSQ